MIFLLTNATGDDTMALIKEIMYLIWIVTDKQARPYLCKCYICLH